MRTVGSAAERKRKLLAKWGVQEFDAELRFLPAARLRKLFHHESSGRLHLQRMLCNFVWQAYTRIRDEKRHPVEGNLRTFFYTDCKPSFSFLGLMDKPFPEVASLVELPRFRDGALHDELRDFRDFDAVSDGDLDVDLRGRPRRGSSSQYLYDTMTDIFYNFVSNGVFNFRDLGFVDDYAPYRFIGRKRSEIIFFAEKIGFVLFTKWISQAFGVTGICLGGEPKFLSSEFFIQELSRRVSLSRRFTLLACVDYDPFGAIIARQFQRQLAFFGMKHSTLKILVTPKLLTKKELCIYPYKLPINNQRMKTIVANWLKETGGVGGKPYGIECDVVSKDRLRAAVEKMV